MTRNKEIRYRFSSGSSALKRFSALFCCAAQDDLPQFPATLGEDLCHLVIGVLSADGNCRFACRDQSKQSLNGRASNH